MPAGTIALTNKSATVAGTGTSFTTELKAGDFVYVNVGGAPYTLVAANITSDTQLTLAVAFDGPTTSGLAWNSVPASLQVAITQKILNDFASVARGRILDFQNWQKIYSDAQSVDVIRPDRTTFTGPSWGYMAAQYANKADKSALNAYAKKGANSDITSLSGMTTALSIAQGGTGEKTKADAWTALATFGTAAGTAAQGNDSRLNSVDGKSGGNITSGVTVSGGDLAITSGTIWNYGAGVYARSVQVNNAWPTTSPGVGALLTGRVPNSGQPGGFFFMNMTENVGVDCYGSVILAAAGVTKNWIFAQSGSAIAPANWISNSDERIKTKIERIPDPLEKMKKIKGVTWIRLDGGAPGIGMIAQDIESVFPEFIYNGGNRKLDDGTVVKDIKSPDTSGVSAALHHEAILALMSIIDEMKVEIASRDSAIEEIQKRLKALDGLDA